MASLGNVDTGGFSKESIAAMQDSDYFKPKRGFEGFRQGASDFLNRFIDKDLLISMDGDSQSSLSNLKNKSYREQDEESLEDRLGKILKKAESGGFNEVGPGFFIRQPDNSARDMAILQQNEANIANAAQAQQTRSNVGRMAGSVIGNIIAPGIGGAVGNFIGGLFCDIRLKEDIAPLCVSEVNDQLSECAFFVKGLNECS